MVTIPLRNDSEKPEVIFARALNTCGAEMMVIFVASLREKASPEVPDACKDLDGFSLGLC